MLGARKAPRAHIRRIGCQGGSQSVAYRAVTAIVLELAPGDSGQVIDDEHLAVGLRARADADRRRVDLSGDRRGQLLGDKLENDEILSGRIQRARVMQKSQRGGSRLALAALLLMVLRFE